MGKSENLLSDTILLGINPTNVSASTRGFIDCHVNLVEMSLTHVEGGGTRD